MTSDWLMVNSVQTAGIIVLCMAVVYVVWRLEKVLVVALAAIKSLTKTHQELIESQNALEDSIADAWRRIEKIEVRQKT